MGRVRTKTVKKSSRQVIERYYSQMTLDFHTNKKMEEERERRMDFVPDESAIKVDQIVVDKETMDMLTTLGMADLPGVEKQPDAAAGNATYPSRRGGYGGLRI
ncbi:40S ribosomal protein [Musa troglodytarum]|uniref:40S ribosomal protein n=1 Tax=Musa troglodytarum TaxID=320322 RepID=A0A9E7I4V8_9LILI|nr:40S ribosomal protein [Musa troglodytarum]